MKDKSKIRIKKPSEFDMQVRHLLDHSLILFFRTDKGVDVEKAIAHVDTTLFPENVREAVKARLREKVRSNE